MNSGSFINKLILIATISLPVAPVISDYFGPATTARWMLAEAALEFDRGNVAQAQKLLEKAYDKSEDLITDKNFWRQIERIEASEQADGSSNFMTQLWEKRIRAIENPQVRSEIAFVISSLLSNRKKFEDAARILAENLPPIQLRNATQNNQLAYMRALAGSDLEQALEEVELAIKELENESFLDTKGWILHRLGRNEEALEAMDKSLSMVDDAWNSNKTLAQCLGRINELLGQVDQGNVDQENAEKSAQKSNGWGIDALLDDFPELSRRLPQMLDVIATMRYHRMRICEALGKTEEVHRDAAWLHAFSPKELDEHF
ncbi:MAG: hypothetical protein ACKOAU_04210 [Pirellula sp.]